MERRKFLKFTTLGLASSSSVVFASESTASSISSSHDFGMASIIDLDLCDGCVAYDTPKCVAACKDKNKDKFPQPKEPMMDYWPQKSHEDYSKHKDETKRLSPYNYTFVESVKVDGKDVFVPRRCMHCDHPPCQKICPFGVISKSEEGGVVIDDYFCFGGAKCRSACPWGIPQRQAGVGVYLKVAPKLAGGGVMYKCDMCVDLLKKGEKPSCEVSCPKGAIKFDTRENIMKLVENETRHIYGKDENAGTRTIYVSSVSFEDIDKAIDEKYAGGSRMGLPHIKRVDNPMEKSENLALASLIAPVAGISAGIIAAIKSKKGDKNEDN